MPVIRELAQGIEDAATATPRVILRISHFLGDAVSRFKSYAPYVISQAVWVLTYLRNGILAIRFINLGGIG